MGAYAGFLHGEVRNGGDSLLRLAGFDPPPYPYDKDPFRYRCVLHVDRSTGWLVHKERSGQANRSGQVPACSKAQLPQCMVDYERIILAVAAIRLHGIERQGRRRVKFFCFFAGYFTCLAITYIIDFILEKILP